MLKKLALGLPAALLLGWLVLSFTLFPSMAVTVAENPVTETPADVDLFFKDITVPSDGLGLAGWWIPAENPRAILIFSHGAGSNRTSWFLPSLAFYKAMVERGVSVITVDMRNHGNSPDSDGSMGMGAEEWPDAIAMERWLDEHGHTGLPRIAMGISMGGATTIYALANGLKADAAILFDPLLNTQDAMAHGGWISFGLPVFLFQPYAWATTTFWGLNADEQDALYVGRSLNLPTLLIQDPTDPITRLPFAQELAANSSAIDLQVAPETPANAECLSGKGRWGAHVAAFKCHRDYTLGVLDKFLKTHIFK